MGRVDGGSTSPFLVSQPSTCRALVTEIRVGACARVCVCAFFVCVMASSRRGSYHVQEGPSGRADLDLDMDHYDTFRVSKGRHYCTLANIPEDL